MLVSVVIPAFDAEATLRYAVASALAQREAEVEVVIVDDGSRDATGAIAEEMAERDSRVVVVRQENRGLPAARNAGISAGSGDLVAFLDSDDMLLPGHVAALAGRLRDARAGFSFCDAWVFDSVRNRFWRAGLLAGRLPRELPATPAAMLDALLERNFVHVAAVARRDALEQVGGYDESLRASEDWDLWLRLLQAGHGAVHVPERLAIYRTSPGQMHADPERMATSRRAVLAKFGREVGDAGGEAPAAAPRAWPQPLKSLLELRWFRLRYPRAVRAALRELGLADLWGHPLR